MITWVEEGNGQWGRAAIYKTIMKDLVDVSSLLDPHYSTLPFTHSPKLASLLFLQQARLAPTSGHFYLFPLTGQFFRILSHLCFNATFSMQLPWIPYLKLWSFHLTSCPLSLIYFSPQHLLTSCTIHSSGFSPQEIKSMRTGFFICFVYWGISIT